MTSRAVVPSVGKALEAGIVVLFIALLTTALYGGVVPDARSAAADEVGERTLQHAANSIESAVPAVGRSVSVERRVDLPETIHNRGYEIAANGSSLVLTHAHSRVGGETPLVLPDRVRDVRGNWTDDDAVVRVRPHPDGGVVVVLAEGSA
ncbi:DUF7266 family protein [Halobacterium zhouii]|uniref:DUF7266 family protein n=1 Tax=Halobacterium zhouii TaxID=2902624 RepID=UPI001E3709F8|nr:hypothetical protein [Halobacterium zhouii]